VTASAAGSAGVGVILPQEVHLVAPVAEQALQLASQAVN